MERRLYGVRNSKRPCGFSMLLGIYTRCTRILFYWVAASIEPIQCQDALTWCRQLSESSLIEPPPRSTASNHDA
jgi:hypothetical protein